jgi:hypothetical protein
MIIQSYGHPRLRVHSGQLRIPEPPLTSESPKRSFNVDAAGGLPHLVAEMLLQSTPGELRVLPALPTAWPTGRITGLRARGGVAIDELTWTARAAAMTCRLVAGSQAARVDARVTVVPPPHPAGPRPSRTVELSFDAVSLTFPEE